MNESQLQAARRRTTRFLLLAVAAGYTAMVAATTISTLVAEQITGATTWAGVPFAAGITGVATGASLLPRLRERFGLRRALIAAYAVAAGGAATAFTATVVSSFPLLVLGMLVIGCGQSASVQTRYISADLRPPEQRAVALSMVVWMGTVGAVVGPNLLAPAGRVALSFELPELAGGYLVSFSVFSFAMSLYFVFLRPDPTTLLYDGPRSRVAEQSAAGLWARVGEPRVQVALVTMVTGHVVMVLIMSMTPLHVRHGGHGLAAVGLIASAHTLGMYAFSPLVGRLVERSGRVRTISLGLSLLVAAALVAVVAGDSFRLLLFALFLLGLGWNVGFVGGSSLLVTGMPQNERARVQGAADSVVWVSAAISSMSASLLLAAVGYNGLCWIGAALLAAPASVLVRHRRRLAHEVDRTGSQQGG